MEYLRFGKIPSNEKSFNYKSVKYNLIQEDILDEDADESGLYNRVKWLCENTNSWSKYNVDDLFENGVSVFELKDGKPVLNNEKLLNSYELRKNTESAYIVTGEEIGKGYDGEPLLVNVKIIKEI